MYLNANQYDIKIHRKKRNTKSNLNVYPIKQISIDFQNGASFVALECVKDNTTQFDYNSS